jgi:ribosome assembly protein YihI (activator of Der GTPase)
MAQTNYIEALIEEGGEITLGALPPHECAATAADGSNCLAMLVRRNGESLNALLQRLDKAIGLARSNDVFIDEVNDGESDLL